MFLYLFKYENNSPGEIRGIMRRMIRKSDKSNSWLTAFLSRENRPFPALVVRLSRPALHAPAKVPGHPDVAWPGKKVALFVNGCFWHRCPHCKPSMPKSNVEYWVVKFERNVERDERSRAALEELGWTVHVIWECQLKKKTIDDTFAALLPALAEELGKELKGI